MPKRHTGRAQKGSQLHLQNLVNEKPSRLSQVILNALPSLKTWIGNNPMWVSPLETENYEEYQDKHFLEKINCPEFSLQLRELWPRGGPVWDGLATIIGKDNSKGVILLEAKSHVGEVISPQYRCKAKSLTSRTKIRTSLDLVKSCLKVDREYDWMGDVYQHANRIAHLCFLRCIAHVPTWLVFLYFLGDKEQNGPESEEGYQEVLSEVKPKLGLPDRHMLSDYIVNVFLQI